MYEFLTTAGRNMGSMKDVTVGNIHMVINYLICTTLLKLIDFSPLLMWASQVDPAWR